MAKQLKDMRNGKIELVRLGINHVVLPKILQYPLSQILQMRWPVILDVSM